MTKDKDDLVQAIVHVIGQNRFEALGGEEELVSAHKQACLTAFLEKLEGPEIDLLRDAYIHISKHGKYAFYDAGTPAIR